MTPKEIAAACLADEIKPLEAAIQLLASFGFLPDQPIWHASSGPAGPLAQLYVASDEVDRIGYIGNNPEWWYPNVRAAKQADLAETQQRMEAPIKAACRAILGYGPLG